MILKTNQELDLIQEYRTCLISDVVTGKIDILNIKIEEFNDDTDNEILDFEELEEQSLDPVGAVNEDD